MIPYFRLPEAIMPDYPQIEGHFRRTKEVIEDGGRRLEALQILDGRLIEGEAIPATTNTAINHKLGRALRGWIVTDQNAAAHIHKVDSDSKTLTLYASAAVTVDIWVF